MTVACYLRDDAIKEYLRRGGAHGLSQHIGPTCQIFIRSRELVEALPLELVDPNLVDQAVDYAIVMSSNLQGYFAAGDFGDYVWLLADSIGTPVRVSQQLADIWLGDIEHEVGVHVHGKRGEQNDPRREFCEALKGSLGFNRQLPDGPVPVMVVGSHGNAEFECVTLAC